MSHKKQQSDHLVSELASFSSVQHEAQQLKQIDTCGNTSNKLLRINSNDISTPSQKNKKNQVEESPIAIDHVSVKMDFRQLQNKLQNHHEKLKERRKINTHDKQNSLPTNNNNVTTTAPNTNFLPTTEMNPPLSEHEIPSSLFANDTIRRGFIRKVLSIIFIQLVLTSVFIIFGVFNEPYRQFMKNHKWLTGVAFVLNLILLIMLYCFRDFCKRVPRNYLLLMMFTGSQGYIISNACAVVEPGVVLLAGSLTTAIVLGLTIYACCSKTDITVKTSLLIYFPVAVLAVIIVAGSYGDMMGQVLVSLAIVGLFSIYLVFDLQRLTGKKTVTYQIDDYIVAALDIYIDVVIIFKELLYFVSR